MRELKIPPIYKFIFVVSVVFVLIGGGGLLAVFAMMPRTEVAFTYPSGGLSNSVFEQQNNHYTKDSQYPEAYVTADGAYQIDAPSRETAVINRTTFQKTEKSTMFCVYASGDYNGIVDGIVTDTPQLYLGRELPKENVKTSIYISETGYLNGFFCHYLAGSLLLTDTESTRTKVLYFTYYIVEIEGAEHLLTGVVTSVANSTQLQSMRTRARDSIFRIHAVKEVEE